MVIELVPNVTRAWVRVPALGKRGENLKPPLCCMLLFIRCLQRSLMCFRRLFGLALAREELALTLASEAGIMGQ